MYAICDKELQNLEYLRHLEILIAICASGVFRVKSFIHFRI